MNFDLNLMTIKMCSPIVGFIIYVIVSGVSLYLTRNKLKRYESQKMENLYNLHSWNEVKFIIVFGVILYGLCQYDQVNVAWMFLLVPLIYLVLRNLLIFYYITIAHQNAPIKHNNDNNDKDKDKDKEEYDNNKMNISLLPAPPIVKKEVDTSIFGMRGDPETPKISNKHSSLPPTAPLGQTNIESLTGINNPPGGPPPSNNSNSLDSYFENIGGGNMDTGGFASF